MKDMSDTDRLEELAKPLAEYLKENCHLHSAIIITAEQTAVIETVLAIPQEESVADLEKMQSQPYKGTSSPAEKMKAALKAISCQALQQDPTETKVP